MADGGRLRRDAVTGSGYAVLATWAWFLYGFGAFLPLLRREQDASRTLMGMHSLALAAGGLIAGSLTVVVVRRLRRRGAYGLGSALVATGVIALTAVTAPAFTLAAVLVAGTGGSMLLNANVTTLTDHHGEHGAAVLSEANAVAALVGLLSPLAVGAVVGLGWSWRPAVLMMLPLLAGVVLAVRRIPAGTVAVDAALPPRGGPAAPLPPVFWTYLVLVMSCAAVEFCCVAWAADLLSQRAAMSPGAASAGVTAVVAGMAVGRFGIGRFARTHSPRRVLFWALTLTLAGWAIVWVSTVPALSMAGLAVTGLGIAGHYPLGASLLLGSVAGAADAAAGRMSMGISFAAGTAPFTLGAVADRTSTHTAFLAVPAFLTLATTALLVARQLASSEERSLPLPPAPLPPAPG